MSETETTTGPEQATAYEFPSLTVLKQAHLRLLETEANAADRERPDATFLENVRDFMLRAGATGRILDDDKERGIAQTLLNYWATVLFRAGVPDETVPRTSLAELDENAGRDLDESQCPYRGLGAYSEETAHLFFGRKDVVERWLKILGSSKSVLVVLGPSGSGKTSLVRAGLLPALRTGAVDGSENWQVRETTLQSAESMTELLAPREKQAEQKSELLVIHRLDEGLLACDRKAQQKLIAAFKKWLAEPGAKRKAVLVGRIESAALVTQWLREGNLTEESEQVFIPPFEARELRAVIEQPAERIGLRFDEGLVDTLINEFLGDPAALALLQFTLINLWDTRTRNRITWKAYHEMGGGQRAIETTAEAAYLAKDFDEKDRELTQKIFLRLVRPTLTSALAVYSVPEADLAASADLQTRTTKIVERFAEKRILRIRTGEGGARVVEVAQEALLRKWPRFLLWLEDARQEMLERQRVAEAAAQWREGGRHRSALWAGIQLDRALAIRDQLSPSELEFTLISQRAATRRRIRAYVILAMLIALSSVVAAYASYRWNETKAALNIESGERLVEGGDPAGAFLFFHQAATTDPAASNDVLHWLWRRLVYPFEAANDPLAATGSLHQYRLGATWWQLPRLKQLIYLPELTRSILSPNGDYLAGMSDTELRVWHLISDGTAQESYRLGGDPHDRVMWASFSTDEKAPWLAVAINVAETSGKLASRGKVIVIDPQTNQPIGKPIQFNDGVPQKVWFGPPGSDLLLIINQLTAGGVHGEVSVWNFRTGALEANLQKHTALPVNWASFSSDGELVVTAAGVLDGGENGEARVWDWKKNDSTALQHDGGPLAYAEFDAEGARVVTAEGANESRRGAARVWGVQKSGNELPGQTALRTEALTAPLVHRGAVTRARFSPDGLWIATASRDRTTRLWHVRTQKEVLSFEQGGDVNDVTFSPDGRYLASAGRDRNARVWELATGQLAQAPLNHSETVSEVAYSRDGRSLVTSSKHLARIWAGESAEPSTRILKTDDSVIATVSKNGERVLTLSGGKGDPPNNLEIRETNTGELIAGHRLGDDERVRFALLNQDGRRCVVAISDPSGKRRTTRVFQVDAVGKASTASERLVPLATFDDNALGNSDVLSGRFDATGERLALVLRKAGATETQVALCELGTKAVRILPGEEKAEVSRVEFSPLGKYVLACFTQPPAQEGHARLWRVDGQASPSSQKLEHSTEITTAAFNRDETFLLTGSTDDNASLWRITDAEVNPVYRLNASDSNTHTADLTRVLFSPDGRHALTAARDQTAILWDLQSGVTGGKRIAVLHHAASVTDAVFSKGGNLILTFSSEPKVRVWSAATGDLLALFNPTGEVMEAGFTSDDKSVYAIAQDLVPRKWSGAPGEEQFAREIRPMSWTIAPLPLRPTDARDLGVLIGARQLDKGVIDKAKTDQLPKKWKTEWSNHSALFQSAAPNEQFFNQALEECEGTKQWFSATWYLTRLLEIAQDEKKRAELRVRRANAYEQADNYGVSFPRGIADREAAISLGQNHASDYEALAAAHLNYGNTFAKAEDANGEWDSAIKAYRVAAGLAPKSSSIHLELGEALAGSRKYAEAQEEFQRALTLTEASAENGASLRARLALTGWLMGGEAGKKQYRDICMTLKDPGTTNALLWPALLTNEFEGDQEFLEMMVNRARIWAEAAPANFYRRNTYGAALYRAGHYEEAIKQLEVARTAYLAERANLLSHRYDRVLRVPISFSVEGRPPDLVFLAMANAKLASTNPQPGRVNPAWDWMRKLRDTSELSQTVRAMGSGPWRPGSPRSYPSAYTTLAIELLYDEAFGVLRQMSTATSPPNR